MSWTKKVSNTFMLLAFAIVFFFGPAQSDPITDCNSAEPKKSLAGCSTLIKGGKLSGKELATAYILRSDAYLALKQIDQAVRDRQKAYELDPADQALTDWLTRALAVRGSQYIEKENLKAALEDFRLLRKLQPKSPRVRDTLSELLGLRAIAELEKNKTEDALKTLNQAISLQPNNAKLYVWRGDAYKKLGLKASMAKDYEKSIKLDPNQSLAFEKRGALFLEDSKYKKAISDFNKVLAKEPKKVSALLLRALASEPLTPNNQAYKDYQTVLKIKPKNKDAKAGLKRLDAAKKAQVKLVQIELQKLGCNPGTVDGQWGNNGKAALARYIKRSGRKGLETQEPGPILLALLKSSKNNICIPPESEKPASCFTFNGEKFCE